MIVGEPDEILLHFLNVLYDLGPAAPGRGESGRRGHGDVGQVLALPDPLHGLLLGGEQVSSKRPQLHKLFLEDEEEYS